MIVAAVELEGRRRSETCFRADLLMDWMQVAKRGVLRVRRKDGRKNRFGVEDQEFSHGHMLLRWLLGI